MNLENIDLLTQKVERVIEVMRVLKTEKAQMQAKINELNAVVEEKESELAGVRSILDERTMELTSLNDTVKGQEDEIQLAQDRFQQLLSTIEAELGTEIQLSNNSSEQEAPFAQEQEHQGEASENNFFS